MNILYFYNKYIVNRIKSNMMWNIINVWYLFCVFLEKKINENFELDVNNVCIVSVKCIKNKMSC